MKFSSLDEMLEYLGPLGQTETQSTPFDMNTKALNVVFRNAVNAQHLSVAFDIIAYANEHAIQLTKGH